MEIHILFGSPGVGKGTYAPFLSKKLGVPHLSTGDLFRAEIANMTQLGLSVKHYQPIGKLVPDSIADPFIFSHIVNYSGGVLLDGYPRSVPQAEYLLKWVGDSSNAIGKVIHLTASDKEIIARIADRRMCSACFTGYSVTFAPPKQDSTCHLCGGKVIQRPDDRPEITQNRLRIYKEQTFPVLEFLRGSGFKIATVHTDAPGTEDALASIGSG